MQPVVIPGALVQVRSRLWRIRTIVPHKDCTELGLEPATDRPLPAMPSRVVLLAPFDRPVTAGVHGAPRVVTRRAWMAALRAALLTWHEGAALVVAARADVELLPYQLEPAIAVIRHGVARLLLADAVGLGKTIEAGLVLAELQARGELERALVLTPPGLRDQWALELTRRFGLDVYLADAAWMRSARRSMPPPVGPWDVPGISIASIDFVKRPEIRRSLEEVMWDAVVVDEAHSSAGDSDRRAVAHACAVRARRVLLLTATPHAGDPAVFSALCGIGALDANDTITMFRRARADVGLTRARRVRLVRVRPTARETAVHDALLAYVRRVWARRCGAGEGQARLAMIVLIKRSLSGMAPLLASLGARLARLESAGAGSLDAQLELPWGDDDDRTDDAPLRVLGAPGFDDAAEECRCIHALIESVRTAVADDSKRRVLGRFVRRVADPVLVFTEYRDTLESLAADLGDLPNVAVLHGGLDRAARADVVRRFTSGNLRILLATDAASEGLNLQHRCRLVVNLELPWNPMRLEQRIGRIDRIGQTRTVHAVNLVAPHTAEAGLLARLAARMSRIDRAVGSHDDVLGWTDEFVADTWLSGQAIGPWPRGAAHDPVKPDTSPVVARVDVRAETAEVFARLDSQRRLRRTRSVRDRDPAPYAATAPGGLPLVATARRHRMPNPLCRGGVLAMLRVDRRLVPVVLPMPVGRLRRRPDIRWAATALLAACGPALVRAGAELLTGDAAQARRLADTIGGQAWRDERIDRLVASGGPLVQPGLFGRGHERRRANRTPLSPATCAGTRPHAKAETVVAAGVETRSLAGIESLHAGLDTVAIELILFLTA
ncbi:MAG: helicase-related protein [Acidobacteria bacterium]|nr:helicase-related protein [Acidobacteriota bacterium]